MTADGLLGRHAPSTARSRLQFSASTLTPDVEPSELVSRQIQVLRADPVSVAIWQRLSPLDNLGFGHGVSLGFLTTFALAVHPPPPVSVRPSRPFPTPGTGRLPGPSGAASGRTPRSGPAALTNITLTTTRQKDCVAYSVDVAYERITVNPNRMSGLPCIRDTRVTVSAVLGQLAAGRSIEEILVDYPYLDRDDILAALEFAAAAVQERELPLAQSA